jgi:hypothetical protein
MLVTLVALSQVFCSFLVAVFSWVVDVNTEATVGIVI